MTPLAFDDRRAALANAVRSAIGAGGQVQSQGDFDAVLVYGGPVNHILHLLVSVFTCGLWFFVWAGVAIFGGQKRLLISVDDYGQISSRRVKG